MTLALAIVAGLLWFNGAASVHLFLRSLKVARWTACRWAVLWPVILFSIWYGIKKDRL